VNSACSNNGECYLLGCNSGWLLGLLFNPDNGGSIFLRNIGLFLPGSAAIEHLVVPAERNSNPNIYIVSTTIFLYMVSVYTQNRCAQTISVYIQMCFCHSSAPLTDLHLKESYAPIERVSLLLLSQQISGSNLGLYTGYFFSKIFRCFPQSPEKNTEFMLQVRP
jgi:hypothetical protein